MSTIRPAKSADFLRCTRGRHEHDPGRPTPKRRDKGRPPGGPGAGARARGLDPCAGIRRCSGASRRRRRAASPRRWRRGRRTEIEGLWNWLCRIAPWHTCTCAQGGGISTIRPAKSAGREPPLDGAHRARLLAGSRRLGRGGSEVKADHLRVRGQGFEVLAPAPSGVVAPVGRVGALRRGGLGAAGVVPGGLRQAFEMDRHPCVLPRRGGQGRVIFRDIGGHDQAWAGFSWVSTIMSDN
jgi:hypothetical protein